MHLPRLGHAVIVNNVASEMSGSMHDVEALVAAYEIVGFDVQVYYNCDTQVQISILFETTKLQNLFTFDFYPKWSRTFIEFSEFS